MSVRINGNSLKELYEESKAYQCGVEAARTEAYRKAQECKHNHREIIENNQKIENECKEIYRVVKGFYNKLLLEKERLKKSIAETKRTIATLQNKKNYYLGKGEKGSASVAKCDGEIEKKSSELAIYENSLGNVESSIIAMLRRLTDADSGSQSASLTLAKSKDDATQSDAENKQTLSQLDNSTEKANQTTVKKQEGFMQANFIVDEYNKMR